MLVDSLLDQWKISAKMVECVTNIISTICYLIYFAEIGIRFSLKHAFNFIAFSITLKNSYENSVFMILFYSDPRIDTPTTTFLGYDVVMTVMSSL